MEGYRHNMHNLVLQIELGHPDKCSVKEYTAISVNVFENKICG